MGAGNRLFGDCAELVREIVQPEYVKDMPYIGLEHISQGQLFLLGYGSSDEVVSAKSRFCKGDILFGKLRPYFRKVIIAPFDGVCSTDIWVVRAKPGIDQRYLFYWMASEEFVEAANRASEGTKMPRAKWEYVERLQRTLPEEPKQRAIAEVLGSLDDKIELNRRMNATLEAIATALFKEWFVDNEETEGWEIGKIKNVCSSVENGGTPSRDKQEYWEPGTIPWLTSGEVRQEIITFTENRISKEGLYDSSAKLWPEGTSVVALYGATAGQVSFIAQELCANQACCGLVPFEGWQYYLYLALSYSKNLLALQARGSAQQNLSQKIVAEFPLVIPDKRVLEKFNVIAQPLFGKWISNLKENHTLAALRDTLLPRLMRGELRIKDLS